VAFERRNEEVFVRGAPRGAGQIAGRAFLLAHGASGASVPERPWTEIYGCRPQKQAAPSRIQSSIAIHIDF